MNRELEEFISECETNNTLKPVQQKKPLICHGVTQRPREKSTPTYSHLITATICTVDYY